MASLCDRVIVMYGGRVVESGAVGDVLDDPRHPYTAGLLVASAATAMHERGTRLPTIPGSVPSAGTFPSGCVFRNRCVRADEACVEVPVLTGDRHRAACFHPLDVSQGPK
jgi:oligopeptide/dipeptide ABC transporter ATP-binding protein